MTEYNKMVSGTYTSTGVAKFISLPFLPTRFNFRNLTQWAATTNNKVKDGFSYQTAAAGTAYTNTANGTTTEPLTLTAGGLTWLTAGTFAYGPVLTITGIVAATGVVTTSAPHGLAVGDAVLLYGTTGELQIAGLPTSVTAVGSTTTFTIGNVPTSGFAGNATAGFAKKILYPDLYTPFLNYITAVTTGTTTIVQTSMNHDFVVGQEVAFVFPQPYTGVWGMNQLDTATYLATYGVPQRAFVTAITTNTITVNVNSTGYTAFAFPTTAQAGLGGLTFPQVYSIGDANTGYTGPTPPFPLTIPGAFATNTRQGVIIGTGNGTSVIQVNADVIQWEAYLDDKVYTS